MCGFCICVQLRCGHKYKNHTKGAKLLIITLRNFQSWKDQTICVPNDKVTVMIADNNEGKSVPVKAFTAAMIGDYLGVGNSNGYIRKRCNYAFLHSDFEDGREIQVLFFHKTNNYKIKVNGKWQSYEGKVAPLEVVNYLGWHVDIEEGIVSCIVDPDRGLPFVTTKPKYNYAFARPLIESARHQMKKEQIIEALENCKSRIMTVKIDNKQFSNILKNTPLLDETEVREKISNLEDTLDYLGKISKPVKYVEEYWKLTQNLDREKVKQDKFIPNLTIYGELSKYLELVVSMPKPVKIETSLSLADNICMVIQKNITMSSYIERVELVEKYLAKYEQEYMEKKTKYDRMQSMLSNIAMMVNSQLKIYKEQRRLKEIEDEKIELIRQRMSIASLIPDVELCPDCGAEIRR